MAFDAGMLACVLSEIRGTTLGARVERVFQPERDEIVLQMRCPDGGRRILINAGASNPRLCLTSSQRENPMTPPMLCMLLRKHLQGARLSDVRQEGFERVAVLEFDTRDEMGFACSRRLIVEMMGKYSNLIFATEENKILAALHTVDFSMSGLRQILPGMKYELPPKQDKENPLSLDRERFLALFSAVRQEERPLDKWILSSFMGVSAAIAREIAYRATGKTDTPLCRCDGERVAEEMLGLLCVIREERFAPCAVLKDGQPIEYAFCSLQHYGAGFSLRPYESIGLLLDDFFQTRDHEQRIRQRAADVLKILTGADTRIRRKIELQRAELAECERGEEYKKYADLITANLYQLSRGMTRAELVDYENYREDGTFGSCVITLDGRLSPAANAQQYYKKYNKSKKAKLELTKQIRLGQAELQYIDTVLDALSHAETAADLAEIREKLYRSGYASRMKHYTASRKTSTPTVMQFRTTGGFRVLCGKNNLQNEYITHRLAEKNDYWFHIKGMPGSHAVMLCEGREPDVEDFTEAAEIAAHFSKGAGASNVEVDYTLVRHVKKPSGTKPGFVIYHTNWSCIVTPNEERIQAMREKGK